MSDEECKKCGHRTDAHSSGCPDHPASVKARSRVAWHYNYQPVPGHEGWIFHIGLGGPCWSVVLDSDSYTFAHVSSSGLVSVSMSVPADLVRWLLDNHPPLDSWRKPSEEEVRAAWASQHVNERERR